MDSRDSPSSTSLNVAREGGSTSAAADDDAIRSATASIAGEAAALFRSGNYGECVDVLKQLLPKKEDDPKVQHNIALAEFLRDGCSDPKKFLEVLIHVKKKYEDLAPVSGEHIDSASQPGKKNASGHKGTNNVEDQLSNQESSSAVYTGLFDAYVATLNMAIVLFHLHDYPKALSILVPLFHSVEGIDEEIALHVCLLLLDAAFGTQDASKFSDVINYLEKAYGLSYSNDADIGSIGQQQPSNLVTKSSSVPSSATSDDSVSDATASANTKENSLARTFSDETMEYESLLSTLNIGGKSLSRPSNPPYSNDILRNPTDLSSLTADIKLKLPLYRVQLLLMSRSLKAAKREVKQSLNITRGRDSSRALLLKSQLEYARGNYPKACRLLNASNNQPDVTSTIMINNNFGCILYQQGKYHASSVLFHRALSNCSSLRKEKPRNLATFSQDKSLLISYNCGVQYLACGKPILAARCFQKASLVFYNRPFLWLRLAECCLMALDKGLLKSSELSCHGSEFGVHVVGQGKWRRLVLNEGTAGHYHVNSGEKENPVVGCENEPKLSMSFARQCLLNALHLVADTGAKHERSSLPPKPASEEKGSSEVAASKNMDHKNSSDGDLKASKEMLGSGHVNSNGDTKDQKGAAAVGYVATSCISEYEEICKRENQMIQQAVLVDLAFVELQLANPLKALSVALSLLQLSECPKMHAFLGHIYAAEALCLLNKPKEAAEHLSIYLSSGNNVDFPYTNEDCEQWPVKKPWDIEESNAALVPPADPFLQQPQDVFFLKPEEARGSLYVNLAAMLAMQGDLEQSNVYAKHALSAMPNSREAVLVAIYLDLKLGNISEAVDKLRSCSHVSFVSMGSTSKGSS